MSDASLSDAVATRLAQFERDRVLERIWQRDRSVWSDDPNATEIVDRLGWLDLPTSMALHVPALQSLADDVGGTFERVVLLGMGGASLAPTVLVESIGGQGGYPDFCMLDSTHPQAVAGIGQTGDLSKTLFVVASKSGSTLETLSLFRYFWRAVGEQGDHFIAITDKGSPLEALAIERGFKRVLINPSDVGGRFSALSLFGLVPAALAGLDAECLRVRAEAMAKLCRGGAGDNPAIALGAWLGEAALSGRDKLVLNATEPVRSFGLWADQLVAESTGKDGRGILPVTGWSGATLRKDHICVHMGKKVPSSEQGDHTPTLSFEFGDPYDLGAEFFRWEFATAVAGAVLGVNPFDQPNVAESKQRTAAVLDKMVARDDPTSSSKSVIQQFMDGIGPGDYIAVTAWVPPSPDRDEELAALQRAIAERANVAVTVAYGPRFLHSAGQLHKGGPASGHFVQLLDPEPGELEVPGTEYSFGDLIHAQALGDYEALTSRGRPVLQLTNVDALREVL